MKIAFRATIHDTAAALRLGGDGAFVTFAVPESDIENIVGLVPLKRTALRITVEVDDGTQNKSNNATGEKQRWP